MNPFHWSQVVPVAVLDRFGELWRAARELGRRPRSLLAAEERARLDQVEAELDDLVGRIRAALPVAGLPALVGGAVELVADVRKVQSYYRRTVCPVARRELPTLEQDADDTVRSMADVLDAARPAGRQVVIRGEGGAA